MEKINDLIIIGSGPAGLAAGIYAARAELDFIVIEKNGMSGGQIINTYEVDNYPGFMGISGFDLAVKFREHCDRLSVPFITDEVKEIEEKSGFHSLKMESGEVYNSKTIIIATGAGYKKLDIPGEKELSGMGVSYCATCDGAFFKNKITTVVGGGDVAVEDAIFLSRMCKKVYVIHRRDEFRAVKSLVSKLNKCENVEVIWDSVVEEIQGKDYVETIKIKNIKTEKVKTIETAGIFIAVGTVPNGDFYKKHLKTDEGGYIIADESCKTNIEGIFAAGDIRNKPLKQIITAASDGANAITAVERYLNEN